MFTHITAIISGALFVMAVIAGVGPQNLNTMSHAIMRNHAFSVATTCFLGDTLLIIIGVVGLTAFDSRELILAINIVGLMFMLWYLWHKSYGFLQPHKKLKFDRHVVTRKQAILQALALTWLNPLVFMDLIVVIGGTAAHYFGVHRLDFIVGAILGDAIWIYGLSIVSYIFAEKLNRKIIWIMLDVITIIIMLIICYRISTFLILHLL